MFLFFQIFECFDLPQMDMATENDVFCKVVFQGVTKYTAIKVDNPNPRWKDDAMFIFPLDPYGDMTLSIDVLDSDGFFRNQKIGDAQINVDGALWESRDFMCDILRASYAVVHVYTDKDLAAIKANFVKSVIDTITTSLMSSYI